MPSQLGGAPLCKTCSSRVYFNEQKMFMSRAWHANCFRCADCDKKLESSNANITEDEKLMCNQCKRKLLSPSCETAPPREEYVNPEDPDCCPRCGKRVYFAEQVNTLGRKWHNACFCCANCTKHLEPLNATDHKGELYCRACYGRKFGPKGYGYAGGAGTGLSTDTEESNVPLTAQAYLLAGGLKKMNLEDGVEGAEGEDGTDGMTKSIGGEYCPRCDKQVYIAERRAAAGHAYHERCFTCHECSKRLEQGKLTEREGEVYCNVCYGKKFGPKGYGFGGGAGTVLNSP